MSPFHMTHYIEQNAYGLINIQCLEQLLGFQDRQTNKTFGGISGRAAH